MLKKAIKHLELWIKRPQSMSSPIEKSGHLISSDDLLHIHNTPDVKKNYCLIDLRTPKEVKNTGIIPGAQVHDYFEIDVEHFLQNLNKDKHYIVYCKVGGRSGKMAQKMREQGFNVKDYNEGMDGWLSKNYKTSRYNCG